MTYTKTVEGGNGHQMTIEMEVTNDKIPNSALVMTVKINDRPRFSNIGSNPEVLEKEAMNYLANFKDEEIDRTKWFTENGYETA